MTIPEHHDAIILGAGGAGLMCAGIASGGGKQVLVLDHNDEPGKKILISGGGRCNFTNLDVRPDRFICQNPHFAKSALSRYTQHDFIDLVNKHNIAWHVKTLGQLFCDGSAKQIVRMLLDECQNGRTEFRYSESIKSIGKTDNHYEVTTDKGVLTTPNLVIATGGPSIPKLGATSFGYEIAKQFGLKLVETRPALVPLTLGKDEALFTELSGVATQTSVSNEKASFLEAALFTHKGLSGPAILQISSYWRHGEAIHINFLPSLDRSWLVDLKRNAPRTTLKTALGPHLPQRLAEALCEKLTPVTHNLADYKDTDLIAIEDHLANWQFIPNGSEGYAKAEVSVGGISTQELSSKTMEAKKVPGLYFIGECVDVTGWLGGYNFQWAWSSGYAAGTAIAMT